MSHAHNRAGRVSVKRKKKHLRGTLRSNMVSRAPNGMPLQERWDVPNYYMGHRPGSRIRRPRERFLQEGRQLSRRNPGQAALMLAPSRNYNNTNMSNILRARSHGWVEATNMVHNPLHGHWGAVGHPVAEARSIPSIIPTLEPGPVLSESYLHQGWMPVRRRVIRPMTSAEMAKEDRFRQMAAENAQRRARSLEN